MKHSSLTVILPTFNEKDNVIPLMVAIKKHTPSNTTIIVVDDNSPDGTAKKVQSFINSHQSNGRAQLLLRTTHRGLTNSLNAGIANAQSDIIIWMDCDFSHPAFVLPKLLSAIHKGADIALASRIHNQGLSILLNNIAMLFFGKKITDYTTGFLAVQKTVLDHIPLRGNYGEYCIDLLVRAQAAKYRIKEIPYTSPPRLHGVSKTMPFRQGYGYIMTIVRLLWTSGK